MTEQELYAFVTQIIRRCPTWQVKSALGQLGSVLSSQGDTKSAQLVWQIADICEDLPPSFQGNTMSPTDLAIAKQRRQERLERERRDAYMGRC